MTENTIVTICWAVAFVFVAHVAGIYLTIRALTTGRGLFERRAEHDGGQRIVRLDR